MPLSFVARIFFCIFFSLLLAYLSVYQQNELTQMRMQQPKIIQKIEILEEATSRLHYQIELFENPLHLMELVRQPQYSHLHHPYVNEIIIIP